VRAVVSDLHWDLDGTSTDDLSLWRESPFTRTHPVLGRRYFVYASGLCLNLRSSLPAIAEASEIGTLSRGAGGFYLMWSDWLRILGLAGYHHGEARA
jgi:hypothetical protein